MQEVASTPMCKKLTEARLDPCVKAVVIRVDSPGVPADWPRAAPGVPEIYENVAVHAQ